MSYNVDTWITKSLDNLQIPMSAFFENERKDWHPKFEYSPDGRASIKDFDFTLEGRVVSGILYVDEINISGECSGTFINWILEPALKQSTGELVAVRIWEGGDHVDRLIVKDGDVKYEEIEL